MPRRAIGRSMLLQRFAKSRVGEQVIGRAYHHVGHRLAIVIGFVGTAETLGIADRAGQELLSGAVLDMDQPVMDAATSLDVVICLNLPSFSRFSATSDGFSRVSAKVSMWIAVATMLPLRSIVPMLAKVDVGVHFSGMSCKSPPAKAAPLTSKEAKYTKARSGSRMIGSLCV